MYVPPSARRTQCQSALSFCLYNLSSVRCNKVWKEVLLMTQNSMTSSHSYIQLQEEHFLLTVWRWSLNSGIFWFIFLKDKSRASRNVEDFFDLLIFRADWLTDEFLEDKQTKQKLGLNLSLDGVHARMTHFNIIKNLNWNIIHFILLILDKEKYLSSFPW